MKRLLIVFLLIGSIVTYGQEVFDGHKWEAPYSLPTPGGWGIERFPIPISFAPEIIYKGIEDIRFTPGWAKADSEEYWSYAFLWFLNGEIKMDAQTIDANLKAYYTGLVKINGSRIPADKVIPVVTTFRVGIKEKGELETFVGLISMTDYMTQKSIALNCKVYVRTCPGVNKTFIFYELSPQPIGHAVWARLDGLWAGFRCDK